MLMTRLVHGLNPGMSERALSRGGHPAALPDGSWAKTLPFRTSLGLAPFVLFCFYYLSNVAPIYWGAGNIQEERFSVPFSVFTPTHLPVMGRLLPARVHPFVPFPWTQALLRFLFFSPILFFIEKEHEREREHRGRGRERERILSRLRPSAEPGSGLDLTT